MYHKVRKAASAGDEHDVFLSHAWGRDGLERDNHERVRMINNALQERKIKTWFDANNMSGSTDHAMTEGIDSSKVIIVFITEAYIDKVNSNDGNNVGLEFGYAMRRHKSLAQVKTVCMEPKCQNPRTWHGPVGARLGGEFYEDFSFDFDEGSDQFVHKIENLAQSIREKCRARSGPEQWLQVMLDPMRDSLKILASAKTFSTKSRSNSHVPTELGRPGCDVVELGGMNSAAEAAELEQSASESVGMGATSPQHIRAKVTFDDAHM